MSMTNTVGTFKNHAISVLVNNEPGVLAKLSGLINRRGFNIESISVGNAREKDRCRLTVVVKGDDRSIEQVQKQIYKMIDTVKVTPLQEDTKVESELAMIKIKALNDDKLTVIQLVNIHNGRIVDTAADGFVVALMGSTAEVDRFVALFPEEQVTEIARSGIVAMNRW